MRFVRALIALLVVSVAAGCAYYNSLYNANRRFNEAERYHSAGDVARARPLFAETIEKAAVSYRQYPSSRWADDALLLIGRSHFALGQDAASAAALRTLFGTSTDNEIRNSAHAVIGAVYVRLEQIDSGVIHLDLAAASLDEDAELGAFARLWRARAAFAQGRNAEAWIDLDIAARHTTTAFDAALLGAERAAAERDSALFVRSMAWFAAAPPRSRAIAPLSVLLTGVSRSWSPRLAYTASSTLESARWPNAMLDSIALLRSDLAAAAADTTAAVMLATRVAESNRAGVGSVARRQAAVLMLASAETDDDLDDVRVLLLPAFDDATALALVRSVQAVQILIGRGATPANALSTYAAAEMALEQLGAPQLARRLFLDYARIVPDAIWAGKAMLAAHDIRPGPDTQQAMDAARSNAYIQSVHGTGRSEDIDRAEERLALGLAGIRADALNEAIMRAVVVGRAINTRDSTRVAARNDSVRIACGSMIDSLRIAGVRRDSTSAACLRGDSQRMTSVLGIDTVALRDTTITPRIPGEVGLPGNTRVRPDTIRLRSP